jgi:uncharacterized membrane protein YjfL (UPF0719 family)
MDLFADVSLSAILSTVIYSLIGLTLMLVAYGAIEKATPFSVRKEIEEDQNVSLGIIIGCMMLGISIIIAATISSPSDSTQIAPDVPQEATTPAPK